MNNRAKSNFIPPVEDKNIYSFWWNLRDELDAYISSSFKPSQNLSNKEKGALKILMRNKTKVICVNDTDKNLGAANTDTGDVKAEYRRQLYDAFTYQKLTEEQFPRESEHGPINPSNRYYEPDGNIENYARSEPSNKKGETVLVANG